MTAVQICTFYRNKEKDDGIQGIYIKLLRIEMGVCLLLLTHPLFLLCLRRSGLLVLYVSLGNGSCSFVISQC